MAFVCIDFWFLYLFFVGKGSLYSEYMSDEESSAAEVQIHKQADLLKLTKPMLSDVTRKSLEHQGYKIIGSHRYVIDFIK